MNENLKFTLWLILDCFLLVLTIIAVINFYDTSLELKSPCLACAQRDPLMNTCFEDWVLPQAPENPLKIEIENK